MKRLRSTGRKHCASISAVLAFMDSSGVGLVIGRTSVMQALGGKVEVVNLTPQAYKVMRLAKLDQLAVIRQKRKDG